LTHHLYKGKEGNESFTPGKKISSKRMREERPHAVEAEKNRCLIFICNVALLTLVKGREGEIALLFVSQLFCSSAQCN